MYSIGVAIDGTSSLGGVSGEVVEEEEEAAVLIVVNPPNQPNTGWSEDKLFNATKPTYYQSKVTFSEPILPHKSPRATSRRQTKIEYD